MDFITKHFLALSAGISGFGATISIIFVSGYLTAFDRTLIWVIEYPDIIKFALIGIALAGASFSVIGFAQSSLHLLNTSGLSRVISIFLLLLLGFIWFGAPAIKHYKENDIDGMLADGASFTAFILFFGSAAMLHDYIRQIRNGGRMTNLQSISCSITTILFLLVFGVSYGLSIQNDVKNVKEITVKDRSNHETIYNKSTIIMILSHHTIFKSDKRIFIIPTSDVMRIASSPSE